MRQLPTLAALTFLLAVAGSAQAIAADSDKDKSSTETAAGIHHRLFYMGTCTTLGYDWPGLAFPITDGPPKKRVTAYICQRELRFVPHDWP